MSKNKNSKKHGSAPKQPEPPAKAAGSKNRLIIGVVAIAAFVVIALVVMNGSGDAGSGDATGQQAYIGRLLPADYIAPAVADPAPYSAAVAMTVVAATQDGTGFSVSLDEVVESKIVRFDYTRPDGQIVPMLAYVKPLGGLFVGVSYCPPCEGEGQRIEVDGSLTCESCGTKRNLETNEGISGPCKLYPIDEVPVSVDGDRIVIDSSVLDTWASQPLDRPVG